MLPQLMTADAVAQYLTASGGKRITGAYVVAQTNAGLLKGARVAGEWRYAEEWVLAYLEAGGTPCSRVRHKTAPVTQFPVRTRKTRAS